MIKWIKWVGVMMEGDCEVLDWLRYYLSLNSLPLHYHYGGCRSLAANPAVRNAETVQQIKVRYYGRHLFRHTIVARDGVPPPLPGRLEQI